MLTSAGKRVPSGRGSTTSRSAAPEARRLGERGRQPRPLLLGPLGEQGAAAHELVARHAEQAAEGVVHLHDRPVGGHDHQAVRQGREDGGGALALAGGGGDGAAHAAAHAAGAERDREAGGQVAGADGAQQAVVGAGLERRGGVGLGARLDQRDEVGRALPRLAGGEQVGPQGLQARPVGEHDPGRADAAAAHGVGVARGGVGMPAGVLEQRAQAGARRPVAVEEQRARARVVRVIAQIGHASGIRRPAAGS